MKTLTLCFPVKRDGEGKIIEVCLAMKKRGFGVGRWNGTGGKVELGETIEQAAVRETYEEIAITPTALHKAAKLIFNILEENLELEVHVYLCEAWTGDPYETEEMNPKWFHVSAVPYDDMWVDDKYWLPLVLEGSLITGEFIFSDQLTILSKTIENVRQLD